LGKLLKDANNEGRGWKKKLKRKAVLPSKSLKEWKKDTTSGMKVTFAIEYQ